MAKKLPRTIVVFVLDSADVETLKFVNTLEGSRTRLAGVGVVEIVTLLQFQATGANLPGKTGEKSVIHFIALIEYKKVDEDVLDSDPSDNSVPGSSEVAAS